MYITNNRKHRRRVFFKKKTATLTGSGSRAHKE